MSKPLANLRLFAAIYPPREVCETMLHALESLDLPRYRRVAPELVHLTLQFIGDCPASQLDSIAESVERSVAGLAPFTLTPRRLVSLPDRGPARLIAAETDAPPTLMEIHRRLAHRFARNPRDRDDERFLPHLTLCRFATIGPHERLNIPLQAPSFEVDSITLMRSILRTDGAEHRVVRVYPLER